MISSPFASTLLAMSEAGVGALVRTVADAVGNLTTYAGGASPFNRYSFYGQPLRVSDPNNVVRDMTCDVRGRRQGSDKEPHDFGPFYGGK